MEKRPSKKQKELLSFIDGFIKGYGYGPSYREVMRALDYKSVSTVAVHVDGLIARGLLHKKDHSARSLEVISQAPVIRSEDEHIKWLKKEIKKREVVDSAGLNKQTRILRQAVNILLDQKGE